MPGHRQCLRAGGSAAATAVLPEDCDGLESSALARDALGERTVTAYLDRLAAETTVLAGPNSD